MNIQRIAYLFPITASGQTADDRRRLVLTAIACVVQKKAADLKFHVSLTDRVCATLSEVMAVLPNNPTEGYPWYAVEDVIDTIRELREMNYIDQNRYDFHQISLTDNLFHEIAREWAGRLGINAYTVAGGYIVYARTGKRAQEIRRTQERRNGGVLRP